jgi:dUTP pyrophosphatase
MVQISIRRVDAGLPLPSYAHPGDAGADLHSAVDLTLQPGERALVATGIAMALPEGYVALVHPRSGLAARHGISIVNAPGTIDSGYRGEVKVCLVNTDPREPFTVRRGDRIAQLVIQRFETASFVEADDLPDSARGAGGYGSTGGFTQGGPAHAGSTEVASQESPEEIRVEGTTS